MLWDLNKQQKQMFIIISQHCWSSFINSTTTRPPVTLVYYWSLKQAQDTQLVTCKQTHNHLGFGSHAFVLIQQLELTFNQINFIPKSHHESVRLTTHEKPNTKTRAGEPKDHLPVQRHADMTETNKPNTCLSTASLTC